MLTLCFLACFDKFNVDVRLQCDSNDIKCLCLKYVFMYITDMATQSEEERIVIVISLLLSELRLFLVLFLRLYLAVRRRKVSSRSLRRTGYSLQRKVLYQIRHLNDVVGINDNICRKNLRMPMHSFKRLCYLVENLGGLRPTRHVSVYEQVAMFLSILSHHKKNVTLQTDFKRSGYNVSVYFNRVLQCIIRLYQEFVVTPTPIDDDCTDHRWKHFKVSFIL